MNMIADFGLAMLDEEIQNAMAGSMSLDMQVLGLLKIRPRQVSILLPQTIDNDMVKTASDIDPRQWVSRSFEAAVLALPHGYLVREMYQTGLAAWTVVIGKTLPCGKPKLAPGSAKTPALALCSALVRDAAGLTVGRAA
jgi:hypothetical protein